MNTFRVKNFEAFQHYKDRAPPWIKLYNEVLDDYDFCALPDASKSHLFAIWLLASRSGNKIPYDAAWIGRRISATTEVDLEILVERGFILLNQPLQVTEQVASKPLAKCLSREEGERETEKKDIPTVAKATRRDEQFEEFWKEYPKREGANPKEPAAKLFAAAVKAGAPPGEIIRGARECRLAEAKNVGTPYIPQAVKWLRDRRWLDYLRVGPVEVDAPPNWDAICASYKRTGVWSKHAPGNDPASTSCQCPPEILTKHGIEVFSPASDPPPIPLLRAVNG